MAISPIDLSGLIHQRSDISKIAGDDFLRIQQQQLASAIAEESQDHQMETKKIDPSEDVKVNVENQNRKSNYGEQDEQKEKNEENVAENDDPTVEYVIYNDPDVGKSLDWKG